MNRMQPLNLASVFAVLDPQLHVTPVNVTATIYEDLDRDFDRFRDHWLFSRYDFQEPWPSWERHPAGDEIVFLLAGDVNFRLETPDGEREVLLSKAGDYLVVPRNIWHTALPNAPTSMLFITPGEGTQNRPVTD